MAQIFNKTFDAGADGALANSEYSNAAGLFDYSAAAAVHGSLGVAARANTSTYGVSSFTATTKTFDQFYMRFPAAPTGTGVVFWARQGTASAYMLRIYADGRFDMRNGYVRVGSIGAGLPYTGEPIRFLVRGDASGAAGTHQIEARAFWGANLENPDPDGYDSRVLVTGLTMAKANWNASAIGAIDAPVHNVLVEWDSHSMDDADWPPPVAPPVADPIAYYWDGTNSLPITTAYHWDGTTSTPIDVLLHVSGASVGQIGLIGDSLTYQDGTGTTTNGGFGTNVLDSLVTAGAAPTSRVDGQVGRPIVGTVSGVSMETVIDQWRTDGFDPDRWVISLFSNNAGASDGQWTNWIGQALTKIAAGGGNYIVYWPTLVFRPDVQSADNRSERSQAVLNAIVPPSNVELRPIALHTLLHTAMPTTQETEYWSQSDTSGRHMTATGYGYRNSVIAAQITGVPVGGPAAQTTVFGANIGPMPPIGSFQTHTEAVAQHTALIGPPPMFRSFLQGIPSSWAASGDDTLYGDWRNRWSWVSMKPGIVGLANGDFHQDIVDYVSSIPVTGKKRMLTFHHEPENNGTSIPAATYKTAYYNAQQSVQSVGHPDVLTGPIFMARYNLYSSGAGHSADAIIKANTGTDLGEVSDFIGWDPYYESSVLGGFDPVRDGEWYFRPLTDYVEETFGPNMPSAIGETGATNNMATINGFAPLEYRPWMMLDVEQWCLAYGNMLAVCYFDNTGFNVPWWIRVATDEQGSQGWPSAPYPTDQGSIDTWAGVYQRNPLVV